VTGLARSAKAYYYSTLGRRLDDPRRALTTGERYCSRHASQKPVLQLLIEEPEVYHDRVSHCRRSSGCVAS
jgi:hypothetical protein